MTARQLKALRHYNEQLRLARLSPAVTLAHYRAEAEKAVADRDES